MTPSSLRGSAGVLALAALLSLPAASCSAPAAKGRPNVVLVVWDTCRADRLSAFGHVRPTTPRLESLAAKGVRYTRCYTPAPWTAPAHGSLFTGVLPRRHGLTVGHGDHLDPSLPTLAESLGRAGYATVGLTANAYISPLTGLSRGFRYFDPFYDEAGGAHGADRALAAVERWLGSTEAPAPGGRPFFLFLNLMDTHLPLDPPREELDAVRDPAVADEFVARAGRIDQPDALAHLLGLRLVAPDLLAGLRVRYDGAARFADRKTGEILDLLSGRGLLEDALVAITSDHGENLGEHGQMDHRLSLYDTVLHVPLVVRRPGRYEGGGTVDASVSLMDLQPTILEAAGIPLPQGTGRDARVLPPSGGEGRLLLAEHADSEAHRPELSAGFPDAPAAALAPLSWSRAAARDPAGSPGARKYIRTVRVEEGREALVSEELYDTAADPGEERNLLLPGGPPEARAAADRLAAALAREH